MSDEVDLLKRVYDRFNARDMETVLTAMHEDVLWANGMDGGHVHGRDEVRSYWTRQWTMIDPHVEPFAFAHGPKGEVVVEVHQLVRDLNENLLADKMVGHVESGSAVLEINDSNRAALGRRPTPGCQTYWTQDSRALDI